MTTSCSFVVPAWNEERLLPRTLQAIRSSAEELGLPHEIVVADDGSTDGTAAVAREAAARLVSVQHRQIAATRNAGARASGGDWLIFVDADTVVSPELLAATRSAFEAGAVGGGSAARFDGEVPRWARWSLPVCVAMLRLGRIASGCYLFCTRAAFEAVGGFDEHMYAAEEFRMSRALRRQGRFVILREAALTSGRKLRAYSARELLGVLARLGPRAVQRRRGTELWYGPRRADPGSPVEEEPGAGDRPARGEGREGGRGREG